MAGARAAGGITVVPLSGRGAPFTIPIPRQHATSGATGVPAAGAAAAGAGPGPGGGSDAGDGGREGAARRRPVGPVVSPTLSGAAAAAADSAQRQEVSFPFPLQMTHEPMFPHMRRGAHPSSPTTTSAAASTASTVRPTRSASVGSASSFFTAANTSSIGGSSNGTSAAATNPHSIAGLLAALTAGSGAGASAGGAGATANAGLTSAPSHAAVSTASRTITMQNGNQVDFHVTMLPATLDR
jgi:hypothetical protein